MSSNVFTSISMYFEHDSKNGKTTKIKVLFVLSKSVFYPALCHRWQQLYCLTFAWHLLCGIYLEEKSGIRVLNKKFQNKKNNQMYAQLKHFYCRSMVETNSY